MSYPQLVQGDVSVSVDSHQLHKLLEYFELGLSVAGIWAITSRKLWREYWSLGAMLVTHCAFILASLALFGLAGHSITFKAAYQIYFYLYWPTFALESILGLAIIYSVFRLAMAPLKGLQSLGMLVFRWAGAISIAVALGSAFTPHLSGTKYLLAAISQLQRTQSILTLCLLLFVCFAIRPMGLTFRSRIFGVSLGLGLMATNDLVQSAWLSHKPHMSGLIDFFNGSVFCMAAILWAAYFALPEAKRQLIVLPTTSPFLRWNQISQALGDSPGYVALGGLDSFAPSEVEIMRRASLKGVTPFPRSAVGA